MERWLSALLASLLLTSVAPPLAVGARPLTLQVGAEGLQRCPNALQSAELYVRCAGEWQGLVEAAVANMDARISAVVLGRPTDPPLNWDSEADRLMLAAQIDGLIDVAPRPAPANEAYFRLLVQPVTEALGALSAAVTVGRWEYARTALDELYNYVPHLPAAAAAPAPAATDAPEAAPSAAEVETIAQRAPAVSGDALVIAYLLGWRWYREPAPEAYLRDFWANQLQRLGQPVPPGADWPALYQQVAGVAARQGVANVTAAGLPPTRQGRSLNDPEFAGFVRNLRGLRYECDVFTATVNLSNTVDSFLRLMRLGAFTDPAWRGAINRLTRDWQVRYQRLAPWTPPDARYAAQQAELLDLLATLNLAAETVSLAQTLQSVAAQPGDPRNPTLLLQFYYREAAGLVRDVRDRIEALPEPTLRADCFVVSGD